MKKATTGKYSMKSYKCTDCGHISKHGTNHDGEIYPKCVKCGWKHPMQSGQVHECLEAVPKDMDIPKAWKKVKLGDLVEIV